MASIDDILHFWFGTELDDRAVLKGQAPRWFQKDPAFDEEIRARFGADVKEASEGHRDAWLHTPRGRLAVILLLDQFRRNLFRGDKRAFHQDPRCQAIVREGLLAGHDEALRFVERAFFYMPLQHAEDLRLQEESVRRYEGLLVEVPPALQPALKPFLNSAIRHRDIIRRFGHFPHRNEILGRDSTEEELTFLTQPGSSF